MEDRWDDVLETLKKGVRKQKPREPNKYAYSFPCDDFEADFNTIVVIVKFDYNEDGSVNNHVRTAYGVDNFSR